MNCIWPLFCTRIAHHLRLSFSREIFSLKETEQWTTSCAWEPLSLADNNVNKLFYWFAITKNIRYFCSLFRSRKTALSLWLKDLSFSIQREMFFFFFFNLFLCCIFNSLSTLFIPNLSEYAIQYRHIFFVSPGIRFNTGRQVFIFEKCWWKTKAVVVNICDSSPNLRFFCCITEISRSIYLKHWRPGPSDFDSFFPHSNFYFLLICRIFNRANDIFRDFYISCKVPEVDYYANLQVQ